jgi:hypothetical protein
MHLAPVALTVYVKCLKYMKLVEFDTMQTYQRIIFCGQLAWINCIFLSGRVKLIITSERLNIYNKCFHQSKAK